MSVKCCDNCACYHWQYDYCEKLEQEMDPKSSHECFEAPIPERFKKQEQTDGKGDQVD